MLLSSILKQLSRNWDCASENKPAVKTKKKRGHKESISHCWYHCKSNLFLRRSIEIPYLWPGHSKLICICLCCPTCSLLVCSLFYGGCTGVINRTHMGSKCHWSAYIKEQPEVPWDRSHWCICGMQSLYSSFLVSEHSCILSQSGQNFIACFWQHVKELAVKPLASDWSAQFFENLYSIQFLFCAKYKLTAEDYIALTATALQLSCSRCNSNVYRWAKSSTFQCMNTLNLALSHHSEGNQLVALEQVNCVPMTLSKVFKFTCKILKNISKGL